MTTEKPDPYLKKAQLKQFSLLGFSANFKLWFIVGDRCKKLCIFYNKRYSCTILSEIWSEDNTVDIEESH